MQDMYKIIIAMGNESHEVDGYYTHQQACELLEEFKFSLSSLSSDKSFSIKRPDLGTTTVMNIDHIQGITMKKLEVKRA